mmetsp:Transcript_7631/g.15705  ORF Transcript_7631/g.15705 Transcript_7631/m.15705 type:complete len:85 (+) Transcript_7631:65-319(+)
MHRRRSQPRAREDGRPPKHGFSNTGKSGSKRLENVWLRHIPGGDCGGSSASTAGGVACRARFWFDRKIQSNAQLASCFRGICGR